MQESRSTDSPDLAIIPLQGPPYERICTLDEYKNGCTIPEDIELYICKKIATD